MSLIARRAVMVFIAVLCFTFGPMALAEQAPPRDYLPIALEVGGPPTVVVEKGDHLWSISAEHLQAQLARSPSADEITPLWHQVIEMNRSRLRSGDPDLIYPGETVVLPDSG